ncbi:uncharacterized protein ISCGN_011011 [Ixodes scapularis]
MTPKVAVKFSWLGQSIMKKFEELEYPDVIDRGGGAACPSSRRRRLGGGGKGTVCDLHFTENDILRETSYTDVATGRVLTARLAYPRLRPEAVPSKFPDSGQCRVREQRLSSKTSGDHPNAAAKEGRIAETIEAVVEMFRSEEETDRRRLRPRQNLNADGKRKATAGSVETALETSSSWEDTDREGGTKDPDTGRTHSRRRRPRRKRPRQVDFLYRLLDWLDEWKGKDLDSGTLTSETHAALQHTTHALVEVARYCFTELKLSRILLGKIQTDNLEERFGNSKHLAGPQYHNSIRQLHEECRSQLSACCTQHLVASARWLEWLFGQNWLHVCTFGQVLGRTDHAAATWKGSLDEAGYTLALSHRRESRLCRFKKEKSSQQSEVQTSNAPVPRTTVAQSASRCRRLLRDARGALTRMLGTGRSSSYSRGVGRRKEHSI